MIQLTRLILESFGIFKLHEAKDFFSNLLLCQSELKELKFSLHIDTRNIEILTYIMSASGKLVDLQRFDMTFYLNECKEGVSKVTNIKEIELLTDNFFKNLQLLRIFRVAVIAKDYIKEWMKMVDVIKMGAQKEFIKRKKSYFNPSCRILCP